MLQAGAGELARGMMESGPTRNKFSFLPKMAAASKGSIGEWLSSSFCERHNSVTNQAVAKGSSLLVPNEIGMLATLQMSRELMKLMRESYAHLSLRHLQDSAEDKDEEESFNMNSLQLTF